MQAALATPTKENPLQRSINAYLGGAYRAAYDGFVELAEDGDAEAQAWLGAMHANGHGVPASQSEAMRWYLLAAQGGHVPSKTNVGAMLVMGHGVEADPEAGARWLVDAAESGDVYAQFNLATMYGKGQGVPQDEAAANQWYERAALGGHYPAQARLGFNYANGIGTDKDRVKAFAWLSLASQHGVGSALKALEGVVDSMSSDEKRDGFGLLDQLRARVRLDPGQQRMVPVPG